MIEALIGCILGGIITFCIAIYLHKLYQEGVDAGIIQDKNIMINNKE